MASPPTSTSTFPNQPRPISLDLDPKSGRRKSSTGWMEDSIYNSNTEDSIDQGLTMYNSNTEEVIMDNQDPSDWTLDEGDDIVAKVYAFLKNYLR